MRPSRRQPDELRAVSLERGVVKYAEGSCFVKFGDTHVLVTATLEDRLPPWLKGQGARLGHRRIRHAAARHLGAHAPRGLGRQAERPHRRDPAADRAQPARGHRSCRRSASGRSRIDCDVIQADGGTRTASITGAWVALHDCVAWMKARDMLQGRAAARPCRRDLLRHLQRTSRCSISTMPRIPTPTPTPISS